VKKKQGKQRRSIEDLLNLDIDETCVQHTNKNIYYYAMPLFNTDLMLPLELDAKIEALAVKLTTFPLDELQFFSNDGPADLSQNIEHKISLKTAAFRNEEQYQLLTEMHEDYVALDTATDRADKEVLIVFALNKTKTEMHLPLIDEMLRSYGAKRLKKRAMMQMFNVYLKRNLKPLTDDAMLAEDVYLPDKITFSSRHFQVDDYHRSVWVIRRYPKQTEHASFATLIGLANTHVSFHLKRNTENVQKLINNLGTQASRQQQSHHLAEALDGGGVVDGAKQLYDELNGGNSSLFDTTILVEVVGASREERMQHEKRVEAQLAFLKVKADKLIMKQQAGFLSMLPLADNNITTRSHPFTSRSFAALFPFSYISKNDIKGVLLGKIAKGSQLIVDFFVRDSERVNGNVLIAGQQGGGKTVQLLNICLQYAGYGHQIFTLDPEGDLGRTMQKVGGINTNVAGGQFKVNFLEVREFGTDEGESEITDFNMILSNHISWVKRFLQTYKRSLSADLLDVIEYYLFLFYHEPAIFSNMQEGVFPIASEFYTYIATSEKLQAIKFITEKQRHQVLLALHSICQGVDAVLFDGATNVTLSNAVNFDIQTLLTGSQERTHAALFNILTYIFSIAIKNRNEALNKGLGIKDIAPMILAVDELYLLLNKESPEIAVELRNILKRDRKYNMIMVNATQNMVDLLQEGLIDYTLPIISNSNKKILLNPGAAERDVVQKQFRLSDKEMDKITHAQRGEFLFVEGSEKYFVQSEGYLLPSIERLIP